MRCPAALLLGLLFLHVPFAAAGDGDALAPTLKDAWAGTFRIGVALNDDTVSGRDARGQALAIAQFNAITAENVMKPEALHPRPHAWDFTAADAFVAFGEAHGMQVTGHTLVWHSQTPAWFFEDDAGRPNPSAAQAQRMRDYIATVAGRYAGRVHGWDVVNEVVEDDGRYRDSPWSRTLGGGEAVVRTAFAAAAEADPGARLYYNDYNAWLPAKREGIVRMVRMLQAEGLRIDGIGMQGHWGLDYPTLEELEAAIDAYAALGLEVMVTELDIDVLPRREDQTLGAGLQDAASGAGTQAGLDPWPERLPDAMQRRLAERYGEIFQLLARKRDVVSRVTFWGLHDGVSWKNDFPIPGRTNHPLLFDRDLQPKPAFDAVLAAAPHAVRTGQAIGSTTAFAAGFRDLVPEGTRIEQLAEGFTWSEGPAWIRAGGYLLFTDVPENRMHRWSERDGLSVFMEPSGHAGGDDPTLREAGANGLFPAADGSLLLADSGSRLVARLDLASRTKTPLASAYDGKRLNSPNDVVAHRNGAVFFTDPPYGLKGLDESPAKALPFNGVYRIDRDGSVHLIDDALTFPNGIALSPDQRTLYVANSDPQRPVWMAYGLDADGTVLDRRVFADATDLVGEDAPGLPDGMAVSADGHLFATGPGGVIVFDPDGRRLGRIETGHAIANCAFGDDGRSLYMTSDGILARVRVNALGLGFEAAR